MDVREFFLVSFSQCVRKVSLADPRLAVPVRLQYGQYPATHRLSEKTNSHLRWLRRVNVQEVFSEIVGTNARRLATLEFNGDEFSPASIYCSDSRNFGPILVVTLPPRACSLS